MFVLMSVALSAADCDPLELDGNLAHFSRNISNYPGNLSCISVVV